MFVRRSASDQAVEWHSSRAQSSQAITPGCQKWGWVQRSAWRMRGPGNTAHAARKLGARPPSSSSSRGPAMQRGHRLVVRHRSKALRLRSCSLTCRTSTLRRSGGRWQRRTLSVRKSIASTALLDSAVGGDAMPQMCDRCRDGVGITQHRPVLACSLQGHTGAGAFQRRCSNWARASSVHATDPLGLTCGAQ